MIWPAKVSRSTMAAQSRGSVKVLVQAEKGSLEAIAIPPPDGGLEGCRCAQALREHELFLPIGGEDLCPYSPAHATIWSMARRIVGNSTLARSRVWTTLRTPSAVLRGKP